MISNVTVTVIEDGASCSKLILRVNPIDPVTGDPVNEQHQTNQVIIQGIVGSPEGVSTGSPGDLRVRQDVPQIWQKITGVRNTTGWAMVAGGGGGGITLCNAVPQAIQGGAVGSAGIDGDAARCDHSHPVPVAAPVTVTGGTNAQGASTSLSRADHQHRLELAVQQGGAAVGARPILNFIGATVADDAGNDRVNVTITGASPGGVPNALAVGQAGAAGVSALYARVDHDHAVPAGVPVTVTGATNSAGAATTFARSDHQHALGVAIQDEAVLAGTRPIINFTGAGVTATDDAGNNRVNVAIAGASPGGVPDQLDVGQVGAAGVSTLFAREDHVHAVPAGTPVTVGTANAAGAAATFARSDHVHRTVLQWQSNGAFVAARPIANVTGAGAPTITENIPQDRVTIDFPAGPGGVPDALDVGQVGAAGVSVLFARADHVHAVPDGTPVTVTGATNSNGVATTFARSDHQHALGVAIQDEAVLAGTRPIINFTGAGVTATDDAGNNRVNVTIPGAGAAPTWAVVLAAGNVSGGTNAVMSVGDTFRGVDSAAAGTNGGALPIRGGNYTGAGAGTDTGGALTLAGGDSNATGAGAQPTTTLRGGDQSGTGAQTAGNLLVRAGDKTGVGGTRGGNLVVRSGQATGGTASSAEFAAGNLITAGGQAGAVTVHGGDNITGVVGSNGDGGFTLIRGGDTPTAGSVRNGSGGNVNIRGGNYRVGVSGAGSNPGNVFIRSGQPDNTSVAGTTGTIRLTTNANATVGDMASVSQTLTPTGDIQIDTIGPGATAQTTGTITLQTGNVAGATGNLPGNIILVAGNMAQSGQSNVGGASITGTAGNSNGNASSPGGSITWTAGNQTDNDTNTNSPGGSVNLVAGTSAKNTATSGGGGVGLVAGNCTGAAGPGGDINFLGGTNSAAAGTARGGNIVGTAGSCSAGGSSGAGGAVTFTAGAAAGTGAGAGGAASLIAGAASNTGGSGPGGNCVITAGAAAGTGAGAGGSVAITAGAATNAGGSGPGGDISLTAGSSAGSGAGGDVDAVAGNSTVELTRGAFTFRSGVDGAGSEVRNKTRVVSSAAGGTTTVNLATIGATNERVLHLVLRVSGQNTTTAGEVASRTYDVLFNRTGGVTALALTNFDSALQNTGGWAPAITLGNAGDTIQVTVGGGINPVPAAANWALYWSTQLGGMAP